MQNLILLSNPTAIPNGNQVQYTTGNGKKKALDLELNP
jgi:hypothetical protein